MAMPSRIVHDRARPHVEASRDIARLAIKISGAFGDRFGRELYSVPALDMLLDLYAHADREPISLTSLCGATSAPPRTALNMINRMVERGILERSPDPDDGRRILVKLTHEGTSLLDDVCQVLSGLLRPHPTAL